MKKLRRCPHCNHNPKTWCTCWMHIYECPRCRSWFCHKCGSTTSKGVRCPRCSAESTTKVAECYGD